MKKAIWFLLFNLMLAMFIVGCMQSCNPQKKLAKAEATLSAAGVLPRICADRFPVKTEYIKGDSVLTFDTLYVGEVVFDTLTVETKDTVYKTITKTLPEKVVTKVVRVTDTVRQENTARVSELTNYVKTKDVKISALETERDEWKAKAKKRLNWLLIVAILLGGYTVLRLKKIISF